MTLDNQICKDPTDAIYTREIIPNSIVTQTNLWSVYPKLPSGGLDSCANDIILGSS